MTVGLCQLVTCQETAMYPIVHHDLGNARVADYHGQAGRERIARAARRARCARRQQSGYRGPAILAVVTAWAGRPIQTPESS